MFQWKGSSADVLDVQLLHENVRYAVTETCLALTIFRDEINFHVVVLFTALVFLKVFHWLAQSRIEFVRHLMGLRTGYVGLCCLHSFCCEDDIRSSSRT